MALLLLCFTFFGNHQQSLAETGFSLPNAEEIENRVALSRLLPVSTVSQINEFYAVYEEMGIEAAVELASQFDFQPMFESQDEVDQ